LLKSEYPWVDYAAGEIDVEADSTAAERGLIRKRCEEGIQRAKRKGVTFGRKRKLDSEMVRVAADRYARGETMAELAEVYGVSEPTIWRALRPEIQEAP